MAASSDGLFWDIQFISCGLDGSGYLSGVSIKAGRPNSVSPSATNPAFMKHRPGRLLCAWDGRLYVFLGRTCIGSMNVTIQNGSGARHVGLLPYKQYHLVAATAAVIRSDARWGQNGSRLKAVHTHALFSPSVHL